MARLIERGLRRSVGVPGLLATAYANVGSSIYYALGPGRGPRPGPDPTRLHAGGRLFALTREDLRRGRVHVPGGRRLFELRAPRLLVPLSALPVHEHAGTFSTALGSTYENDPVLGIVNPLGLGTALEHGLRAYLGVLAATILLIATNAGLIGVSRLS